MYVLFIRACMCGCVFVCRFYLHLPLSQKPCVQVVSLWEDRTYRLFTSNLLENIALNLVHTHTHAHTHKQRLGIHLGIVLKTIILVVLKS